MQPTNEVKKSDFNRLVSALEAVALSSTKKAAERELFVATGLASGMRYKLDGYMEEQLTTMIIWAKEASGRVRNKEQSFQNFKTYLYKFERGITLIP